MPVNPIEAGSGHVWQSKQAALGTRELASAATMKHLRKAGDDGMKANKVIGSEPWVDGQAFASPSQYIDAVGGDVGPVTFQAQIATAGFEFAQIIGVDVVTGTTPDYTHTIAAGNANGAYQTFYQQAGVSVGPLNFSFWDALLNTLTWNCGQDQKTAHMTAGVMALQAAEWFTTAPTITDATTGTTTDQGADPFTWNEVTGAVTIDAVAFAEADGDTLEIDRKLDVHRGDSAAPACFIRSQGEINRTISAIVTDNTIPKIKSVLYGTASPADGADVSTTPSYVALKTVYTRSSVRSLSIDTPKVGVNPSDWEMGPKTGGGKIPVTFGGQALKSGATAALTIIAKTGDPTVYV